MVNIGKIFGNIVSKKSLTSALGVTVGLVTVSSIALLAGVEGVGATVQSIMAQGGAALMPLVTQYVVTLLALSVVTPFVTKMMGRRM